MALPEETKGANIEPGEKVEDTFPPAVPTAITIPCFSKGFKEILTAFVGKLIQAGVPRDKMNKALSEMLPEIKRVSASANGTFQAMVSDYLRRKEQEELRSDYLGRALLFEIEKYFPANRETANKLVSEPVEGYIPLQVADGLVAGLKGAHGMDTIKEYSETCARKAEQYRSEEDQLIDIGKFINDPEVKKIATDILTRFRLLMHKKSEADQRKWLLNQITTAYAFREMKRDLSEWEVSIVTLTFLKFK